ncbi:hypothetical protein Pelo_14109 [Pelomyxa schiedti]|nr:hypothetical protein Pelo_14109 [Pelomyxa schiedti]
MQVGEWCQTGNPELAMVAYMKAKYAGSRESSELWEKVWDIASADSSLKDNIIKSFNSYTAEEACLSGAL